MLQRQWIISQKVSKSFSTGVLLILLIITVLGSCLFVCLFFPVCALIICDHFFSVSSSLAEDESDS